MVPFSWNYLLAFVIAGSPGALFIWAGISGIVKNRRRQRQETVQTVGKIVDLVPREWRTGKYRNHVRVFCTPVVRFKIGGDYVEHKSQIEYRQGYFDFDQTVTVLYDPNDPSNFHLERHFKRIFTTAWRFIAVGVLWLAWCVVAIILYNKLHWTSD